TTVASVPSHHTTADAAESVANDAGGRRRAAPTIGTSAQTTPTPYATTPAAASSRTPVSAPTTPTPSPPSVHASVGVTARTARGSIVVRSIVGHSVTSVPSTVSPTNPRTLSPVCARTSRACQPGPAPRASRTPTAAPNG